jgi:serine/threonine protein kinase
VPTSSFTTPRPRSLGVLRCSPILGSGRVDRSDRPPTPSTVHDAPLRLAVGSLTASAAAIGRQLACLRRWIPFWAEPPSRADEPDHHAHLAGRTADAGEGSVPSSSRACRDIGNYTLIHPIGQGGMGRVWLAEHRLLARPVAIKLIDPDLLNRSRRYRNLTQRRFEREVRAIACLRSPNTVSLYEYGVGDHGTLYFVMEMLDGIDLEDLVTTFGPQRPARVINILIQICNSLAEAHGKGIVHRDIKPANIYLCRLGTTLDVVKVLDFGLAAETGSPGSDHDQILGTPAFMAPEQALAQPIDGRADLYAVGCLAWWLLTGRTVFVDDDARTLIRHHINTPAPDLDLACPFGLPRGLAPLVASLLDKEPARRPRDALTLRGHLLAILRTMDAEDHWVEDRIAAWWRENLPIESWKTPRTSIAPPSRRSHTRTLEWPSDRRMQPLEEPSFRPNRTRPPPMVRRPSHSVTSTRRSNTCSSN